MDTVLTLITALIFYTLGRYSGREKEELRAVVKQVRRRLKPNTSGPIEYVRPEDLDYAGSEREKIDQEQERLGREAGLIT